MNFSEALRSTGLSLEINPGGSVEGASIRAHFATLEDPRIARSKEHQLLDIVVLAICAVGCGAEGWAAIELFGRTKLEWLRRYVPLANGIPAHARDGLEQACEATTNERRLG